MELAHLKITKGTGKLADMLSLNTNTASNEFCKAMNSSPDTRVICKTCYSMKALSTYRKNCATAWQHNSDQLSQPLFDWQLPRLNSVFFRFSSHGELINETHAINLFRICEANPKTTFSLYTKRHKVIYKALKTHKLPDNLILVYSNPIKDRVMTKENGFSESSEIMGQLEFKLFSVNQIINMANTIINFKEVTKNEGIDTQVQFQNHFDDVTKLINSPEVKGNVKVINNKGTPKLLNMLDVYISTALVKKEYKSILDLIKQVAESSKDDKEFMKHLENNNFVFVAQSFTKNSQTPNQIRKLIK